ncbi:MAG: hypothetical protein ACFFB5_24080 [Promethearchaeota archaeon]
MCTITNTWRRLIGVGRTGARIVVTLLHKMLKRQNVLGLITLCSGGGLGMSFLVTRDV